MLLVQAYLRSVGTLESLKGQYAINYRVDDKLGVVCLNYNQIESNLALPIVQECRQLILELDTWNVVSISFEKFFNYSEQRSPDFNWSNFKTYVTFWHHKNYGWQLATRSIPNGEASVDDSGLTFKELVMLTLEDMGLSFELVTSFMEPGYSYITELCCPENQVVVHHQVRSLTLLAVRSIQEPYFKECDLETWASWNSNFPLPLVALYDGFSLEAVLAAVQGRKPIEHEGYVLVDKNFNRVKIKSDLYILLSHQRDGLGKSEKTRLALVLSEQDDDIMGLLPKFVQDKITNLKIRVTDLAKKIDSDYQSVKDIETQKGFALVVMDPETNFVYPAMFAMRKGICSTGMEYIKHASQMTILRLLGLDE